MKLNHNMLAGVFALCTGLILAALVYLHPEISIAPQESAGRIMLKVACFFLTWTISLKFLCGWGFSITANAQSDAPRYGIIAIACAIIIGCALVVASR
jgi:uncharacterized membrane protein